MDITVTHKRFYVLYSRTSLRTLATYTGFFRTSINKIFEPEASFKFSQNRSAVSQVEMVRDYWKL